MSTCPSCGSEIAGQWKFCLQCGHPLGPIVQQPLGATAQQPLGAIAEQPLGVAAAGQAAASIPAAIRPEAADATRPVNLLAVVAFVLGIIGGPISAVFGHFAAKQIAMTGERGMLLARIAIVLGFVWLALWIAVIAWIVVVGVG